MGLITGIEKNSSKQAIAVLIKIVAAGIRSFFLLDLPKIVRDSPRVFSNFSYFSWDSHLDLSSYFCH